MNEHTPKAFADVRKGDFVWSDSLNRWVMALEAPSVQVIRMIRVHKFLAILPSGDQSLISETGEPGSPTSLVNVHNAVPDCFLPGAMDQRMDKLRTQMSHLTQAAFNLGLVEVYADQALERAE